MNRRSVVMTGVVMTGEHLEDYGTLELIKLSM